MKVKNLQLDYRRKLEHQRMIGITVYAQYECTEVEEVIASLDLNGQRPLVQFRDEVNEFMQLHRGIPYEEVSVSCEDKIIRARSKAVSQHECEALFRDALIAHLSSLPYKTYNTTTTATKTGCGYVVDITGSIYADKFHYTDRVETYGQCVKVSGYDISILPASGLLEGQYILRQTTELEYSTLQNDVLRFLGKDWNT